MAIEIEIEIEKKREQRREQRREKRREKRIKREKIAADNAANLAKSLISCEKCYRAKPIPENKIYDHKVGEPFCSWGDPFDMGPALYFNLKDSSFNHVALMDPYNFLKINKALQVYFGDSRYDSSAALNPQLRKDFTDLKSLNHQDLFYFNIEYFISELHWSGNDIGGTAEVFVKHTGIQTDWDGKVLFTTPHLLAIEIADYNGVWKAGPEPKNCLISTRCWVGGGVSFVCESYEEDPGGGIGDSLNDLIGWGSFILGIGMTLAEATMGISLVIAVAFQVISTIVSMSNNESDANNPYQTTISVGACLNMALQNTPDKKANHVILRATGYQLENWEHICPNNDDCANGHATGRHQWRDHDDGAEMTTYNYIQVAGPFDTTGRLIPPDEFEILYKRLDLLTDPEKVKKMNK